MWSPSNFQVTVVADTILWAWSNPRKPKLTYFSEIRSAPRVYIKRWNFLCRWSVQPNCEVFFQVVLPCAREKVDPSSPNEKRGKALSCYCLVSVSLLPVHLNFSFWDKTKLYFTRWFSVYAWKIYWICVGFLFGSTGGLNSGPHTCEVGALSAWATPSAFFCDGRFLR
jgi:hypothetical protein